MASVAKSSPYTKTSSPKSLLPTIAKMARSYSQIILKVSSMGKTTNPLLQDKDARDGIQKLLVEWNKHGSNFADMDGAKTGPSFVEWKKEWAREHGGELNEQRAYSAYRKARLKSLIEEVRSMDVPSHLKPKSKAEEEDQWNRGYHHGAEAARDFIKTGEHRPVEMDKGVEWMD